MTASPPPFFSVIIATHNRPDRLCVAIESVRKQTYPDWELIVVDDGSDPPASLPLLHDHPSHRMRILRQDQQGPGAARKRGVAEASGAWLCFLDDDDYYLPQHLTVLAQAISERSSQMAVYVAKSFTRTMDGELRKDQVSSVAGDDLIRYWESPHSLLPVVVPRQIARETPLVNIPSPIEDFEWLCHLFCRYPSYRLPDHTVVYVEHGSNRTNRLIHSKSLHEREQVIRRLSAIPEILQRLGLQRISSALTHQRLHWTRQCIRAGQFRSAWYGLWRGISSATLGDWREVMYTLYVMARQLVKTGPHNSPAE